MGNIDILKSKQQPPRFEVTGVANIGNIQVDHLNTAHFLAPMRPNIPQPTLYEPKRNNRFILRFGNGENIQDWMIRSVTRPSGTYNHVNGLFTWSDLEVTLMDSIGPSTSRGLMEILRTGEEMEFNMEMLDPTGVVIESWLIVGFISQFDFGTLAYSDPGLTQITIRIRVNECTLRY